MKSQSRPVMSPDEFRRHLVDHKGYCTPSSGIRRVCWFPSLRYHATVLRRVFDGGRLARHEAYNAAAWAHASATILLNVEALGGRLAIDGLESLAALDRPCVVVANHMSALETHVLACMILPFTRVTFVVKRSLLAYPGFGAILRNTGAIGVTRKNPREDFKILLTEGIDRLRSGVSLVLFPQAHRRAVFDPSVFNSVAAKLAARADVSLIPVALKTDFLARGFPIPDGGRVHPDRVVRFSFGPAVVAAGRDRLAHREVVDFIHQRLRSWGAPCVDG